MKKRTSTTCFMEEASVIDSRLSTTNIISTSVNLDILKDCRRSLLTYFSDILQHVFVRYMHTYTIRTHLVLFIQMQGHFRSS